MDIRKMREQLYQGKSIYQLPLTVTFYARVSTDKEEQASSLENQVAYFTHFIAKSPHWTYARGYIDEGLSGTSTQKRDSFKRMIEDGKQGKFDLIITKEISRFSRNTLDSIHYTQELLHMGVGVLFQNDNINTLDPDSEFRLVIMAAVAQDEMRKLSQRLKFGFRQSMKNGRVLGNNNLYGYHKENCKLSIVEEEAQIVREMFHLYANKKMGFRRIARYLQEEMGVVNRKGNAFHQTSIKNIISNPKYKGYYCGNRTKSLDYKSKKSLLLEESEWLLYKDPNIPTIVSQELWDKANALLKTRGKHLKNPTVQHHARYPYSGKIICAQHNASFHRQVLHTKGGEKEVWQCKMYRHKGLSGCTAPQINSGELTEILANFCTIDPQKQREYIAKTLALIENSQDNFSHRQIEKLQATMKKLQVKKEKLLEFSIQGVVSTQEFQKRNQDYNLEISRLSHKKQALEKAEIPPQNQALLADVLREKLDLQNKPDPKLLSLFLEKVLVETTENRQEIHLKIHLKTGEIIPVFFKCGQPFSFCNTCS